LKHGDERGKIPFTLLETTAPGRLMIAQAEFIGSDVDQRVVLSLLQNALIGNVKYFWRGMLTICILGLKSLLWIFLTVYTQTELICYCYHVEEFEQLD
jgi:hypothetical protein